MSRNSAGMAGGDRVDAEGAGRAGSDKAGAGFVARKARQLVVGPTEAVKAAMFLPLQQVLPGEFTAREQLICGLAATELYAARLWAEAAARRLERDGGDVELSMAAMLRRGIARADCVVLERLRGRTSPEAEPSSA